MSDLPDAGTAAFSDRTVEATMAEIHDMTAPADWWNGLLSPEMAALIKQTNVPRPWGYPPIALAIIVGLRFVWHPASVAVALFYTLTLILRWTCWNRRYSAVSPEEVSRVSPHHPEAMYLIGREKSYLWLMAACAAFGWLAQVI